VSSLPSQHLGPHVFSEASNTYPHANLSGGVPPYIYGDIGGVDRWVWFVLANLLALAAVCPFVGALSDLLGRRYVAMVGCSLIVIGMIVCSTVHDMNSFIGEIAVPIAELSICQTGRKHQWLVELFLEFFSFENCCRHHFHPASLHLIKMPN
jgi:MFS family permease